MKKKPAIIQGRGILTIGKVSEPVHIIVEFHAKRRPEPDGKGVWYAGCLETVKDTGELINYRIRDEANKEDAVKTAKAWQAQYNVDKKKFFEAVEASKQLFPAPEHCEPLEPADSKKIETAENELLRLQWPRTYKILSARRLGALRVDKASTAGALPQSSDDAELEKAWLLDATERGYNPKSETVPYDMDLFKALVLARNHFEKRKKSIVTDAKFHIALNWKYGWCYLSAKAVADNLNSLLKPSKKFDANMVRQYTKALGLKTKRMPGPDFKVPTKSPIKSE